MSKLSLEKKLEIVEHYLTSNDSYKKTADLFSLSKSYVQMLVGQFKQNGIEGLTHTNGSYTGQFKLDVLKYQQEHNLSDPETAVLFKIPNRGTICTWRKKYITGGYDLLCRDGRGAPKNMANRKQNKDKQPKTELEKLRDEVQDLRMENAILKKLNALIQEREAEESGLETNQESSEN